MKFCGDKTCRRAGKKLRAAQFPRNKNRPDGRCLYCRECSIRQVHEFRVRKKAHKLAQREAKAKLMPEPLRKPNITAADRVQDEVKKGARTIEELQKRTRLRYDVLGELLVTAVWETKTIRIQRLPQNKREFVAA